VKHMSKKMKEDGRIEFSLPHIKKAAGLFSRFGRYALRYWKFESLLLLTGNISIVLALITPYLGKNALDKGILAKNPVLFIRYVLIAAVVYFLRIIAASGNDFVKTYVTGKVRLDLSRNVLKKLDLLPLNFFRSRSTGECIYRLHSDIGATSGAIVTTLPNIALAVFKLLAITVVIFFIDWKILLLIAGYNLLTVLRMRFFTPRTAELIQLGYQKSQDAFKILNELFSNIYFLKASGKAAHMLRKYFGILVENFRLDMSNYKLRFFSGTLSSVSDRIFFGLIGFIGSLLVIRGELSLGSLAAIMAYISQGVSSYGAILGAGRQLILNGISLRRVTEVLDADTAVEEKKDAKEPRSIEGRIEFKGVSFGYTKDKSVFDGINFFIQPKAKVALVGHSGCGKTTLLNLILRLYDVDRGAVFLGGYDVRDLRFRSIYSHIGITPQQPFLLNETVRYNIAYENPKMDIEDVVRAAQLAEAHDFIEGLPKGYETVVGEAGCVISQGQRQRLAIARTLARRPKVLMLDEALSSVDSETESKIIANIRDAFRDSTVIIVSHRITAVKMVDLVYFLEGSGKMTVGIHGQLTGTSTAYRDLFAPQAEETKVTVGDSKVPA